MTDGSQPPANAPASPAPDFDKHTDDACAAVSAEIARTDSKGALLIAFVGAVLAGIGSVAGNDLPFVAQVVGGFAAFGLVVAAWLLLLVVRPDLGERNRTVQEGFLRWAQMTETELQRAMTRDDRITRLKTLSAIAVRKFELLTRAVDIIRAVLILLSLAAGTAL
ncbi:Pycsar system effector family protein [Streptomyces niveus]|uniref:Pycsar system effector family protein n=1 Tax=Streptomyces niveus TaxID=193462 RepID=UPI0036B05AEC